MLLESRPFYDHDAMVFERICQVLEVLDIEQVGEVGPANAARED